MKSPDGEWPIKYTYSIHETRSPISPFANKFVSLFKVTPFSQGTHLVGGGGGGEGEGECGSTKARICATSWTDSKCHPVKHDGGLITNDANLIRTL